MTASARAVWAERKSQLWCRDQWLAVRWLPQPESGCDGAILSAVMITAVNPWRNS